MTTIYLLIATPLIIACLMAFTARCVLAIAIRRLDVPRRILAIQYEDWKTHHAYLTNVTKEIDRVVCYMRDAGYRWEPSVEELVIHPARVIQTHLVADVWRWRWAGITWTDRPFVGWWFHRAATYLFVARLPRQFWAALDEYQNSGLTYNEIEGYTRNILLVSARHRRWILGAPPAALNRLLTHRLVLFLQRGAQLASLSVSEHPREAPPAPQRHISQQLFLH